jgi:ribosomal protein S18 acetylase RimI-like enzyme
MERPVPRSLVWATELDVLALDAVVERRDCFLAVRSPASPTYYWGNLLLFDREPAPGDGPRWEALYDGVFGDDPRIRHKTFAWDRGDGVAGAALEEFGARGYDVEENVGLVAERPVPHPRENRDVAVRALGPSDDDELWGAVAELNVATRDDGHDEGAYRTFARGWLESRRALFCAGRGGWYVALDPVTGALAGSCGIVVTEGRGRFQMVVTAPEHRRRGVCSRLVVEASRRAAADHGAERFVIVAEAGSHALGLYGSLGFERREHVLGVCRWPRADGRA